MDLTDYTFTYVRINTAIDALNDYFYNHPTDSELVRLVIEALKAYQSQVSEEFNLWKQDRGL